MSALPLINARDSPLEAMGCIPSKQAVLEADGLSAPPSKLQAWKARRAQKKERARARKARYPPSPVIPEDAPPWVTARHAVLTEKDGQLVVLPPPGASCPLPPDDKPSCCHLNDKDI